MPVSLPRFIKKAFATDGLKTSIPDASDNITGRAGYNQGFPPITFQPKEAGGIPPSGFDMNGVIYDVTLAISYIQSGKSFPFNADFATAIGGYPSGAVVSDASNATLWLNGVSNNFAFPSGWTNFSFSDPTENIRGTPLVAKSSEIRAGENSSKIITPAGLKIYGGDTSLTVFGNPGSFIFNVPEILRSGVKKPYVIVVGAGGGCLPTGGILSRGAGGGGSAEDYIDLTGVFSVPITVGLGTTGDGGTSSFGSYMSATGGTAGKTGPGIFSTGGVGVGSAFNRFGGSGGGPDATYSGEGGSSPYSSSVPRSSSGLRGMWPGGGAGSGTDTNNVGANGAVIIKW